MITQKRLSFTSDGYLTCLWCVLTGLLSGYVDVNINDKVFAEAHVGLVNLQVDLLRAEACYRGRLSYNMNLIKVTFPLVKYKEKSVT